jgi:hypothetical protein
MGQKWQVGLCPPLSNIVDFPLVAEKVAIAAKVRSDATWLVALVRALVSVHVFPAVYEYSSFGGSRQWSTWPQHE